MLQSVYLTLVSRLQCCRKKVILKIRMGGVYKYSMGLLCAILASGGVMAQTSTKTIFTDRNYRQVQKEKEASYEIAIWEKDDTVYFETLSKNPKGKIETGKYPKNEGFDLRNCFLIRYWPNGNVRSYGQMKQSWNEGLWHFNDETGVLYSMVEFKDGLMTGTAKRFYLRV
jgi:antitoxin component YwqK of YwqJK toxin-antitoxin module